MNAQEFVMDEPVASAANAIKSGFNEHQTLRHLKHYLPAQAPLKDFIHHNTLHAFQHLKFHEGLRNASEIFGYKTATSLKAYRALYNDNKISEDILDRILADRKEKDHVYDWKKKVIHKEYGHQPSPRIGGLRSNWKRHYRFDMDSLVHPILFRVLCSFLDQGISVWQFPIVNKNFLDALREMEMNSFASLFRGKRARKLMLNAAGISDLLKVVVGDESLYEQYLFDQQFAHQGWSGMVSTIEDQPQALLDKRNITLRDIIVLELLLEIDALDSHFGERWEPIVKRLTARPPELFSPVAVTEFSEVISIWQDALEWSYYDQVLAGLTQKKKSESTPVVKTFQAIFCIDDREASLRRYLELRDRQCQTFSTAGFFGVEFFYQPQDGKFYSKLCPAPVTPQYLIKEISSKRKTETDLHLTKHSHSFFGGWIISQTLGFWAAFRLFLNIFRPSMSPATASSFRHMDQFAKLTIENVDPSDRENNLQIGFTVDEMVQRVEAVLKSIGLVKEFAPLVYVVGHGSSSVNNPHYAAYDCGACSGRAGSVNSRVFCYMANHHEVRARLIDLGITIPEDTQFVGGLHDTTRDEIMFFDEDSLTKTNTISHIRNHHIFNDALELNAKERARRFERISLKQKPAKVHQAVKSRSVSLFEPRPELNHATNALCIVGRRDLTKNLFLDRRAFLNSFDYLVDPEGTYLLTILKAAAPVCGGINLEYLFSRVDNQKLGAGSKLPHNVMGLFGVANGIDGDLRPGLPSQMIEVHDPIRLMIVVEHFPNVVLETIRKSAETYEWFMNEWIHLVVLNPESKELSVFRNGAFQIYQPLKQKVVTIADIMPVLETHRENLPVYIFS